MASLVKQAGSKNWYVVFWLNGKQKWRSTGTDNIELAERARQELEATMKGQACEAKIQNLLTEVSQRVVKRIRAPISGIWEIYQSQPRPRRTRDRTEKSKQGHLQAFADWMVSAHPESKYLDEVTRSIAKEYFSKALGGVSGQTHNNHLSSLRSIFQLIHDAAGLSENPWDAVPRVEGRSIRKESLTLDQVEGLYRRSLVFESRSPGFWPVAIALGFHTGLRWGDICTLGSEEIFIAEEQIRLIENKKWRKGQLLAFSLHPDFKDYLIGVAKKRKGDIWPVVASAYRVNHRWLMEEWNALCELEGIQTFREATKDESRRKGVKVIGFHSLRHTFVTLLEDRGADRSTIQQIIGHGSPVMTGHYSHSLAAGLKVKGKLPSITGIV